MSKRLVVTAVFISSAFVDAPSYVTGGSISLMGVLTIVFAVAVAVLAFWRPLASLPGLLRLWPLSLLFVFSVIQLFLDPLTIQAAQTLCLQSIFLGLILLTSTGELDGIDEMSVSRMLHNAALFASLCYLIVFLSEGFGPEEIGAISFIAARSYALFALLGVALFASRWAGGSRRSFWFAAALVFLIALSLSRTALALALMLIPLSRLSSAKRPAVKQLLIASLGAMLALTMLVLSINTLRSRFIGDNSVEDYVTGEASIDTSGRLTAWAVTLGSYLESPWIGKGPGSANELMDDVLYRLEIGHPLNEYLRFLHDEGLVGFLLFLAGVSQLLILCWQAYRRSLVNHYPNSPFYLATFLALLAALLSMLTDNTASYIFVMGPLGVMVGITLRSLALDTSTVIAATDHGESADFGLARSSL